MELMSPAGSKESFIAAIESGADSVYLGLKNFNARKPASNFSLRELKQAKDYALCLGKKIYLTLNIDLKSNELKEVASILKYCSDLNIDGVIIKDPALILIINEFFKNEIEIHFSTQNTIESSYGVLFAKKNNVKRVVLARELTFDEIKKTTDIKDVEIEVFTEGSMCFSISGKCLMSSFVGGRGGNRGQCQAPCRINWQKNNDSFTFFSMKDLSLIPFLKELEEINVKALKIEGRLKNPMWVSEVTSIYRKALSEIKDKSQLGILSENLKKYSAREKDTGHLFSHLNLIGKNRDFESYKKDSIYENTKIGEIFINDYKIKLLTENGFCQVELFVNGSNDSFLVKIPPKPKKARLVSIKEIDNSLKDELNEFNIEITNLCDFDLNSSSFNNLLSEIVKKFRIMVENEDRLPKLDSKLESFIDNKTIHSQRKSIVGNKPDRVIINSSQIDNFINTDLPIDTLVISLSCELDYDKIRKIQEKSNIIFSIPPVLFEKEAESISAIVKDLYDNGFRDFEANSYTGMEILSKYQCKKSLGYEMGLLNEIAADFFYELGYESIYVSIESDLSVLKSVSSFSKKGVNCLVFGKPILFYSRVDEDYFKTGEIFKDKFTELCCVKENNLNLFINEVPFSLIGDKFKKENIYFDALSADLRYFKNPEKVIKDVFENKFNLANCNSFNFFRKMY